MMNVQCSIYVWNILFCGGWIPSRTYICRCKQVDLTLEAAHLQRFIYNFRKSKDVSFPSPIYPLVHPTVLVEVSPISHCVLVMTISRAVYRQLSRRVRCVCHWFCVSSQIYCIEKVVELDMFRRMKRVFQWPSMSIQGP